MRHALALLAALAPAPAAVAQEAPSLPMGEPEAGRLLVIDRDRVLAESERGRALLAELDADSLALAGENREIEARLRAEERALTERRPEMDPAAFRAEAEAFDARVQEIRDAQDAKRRDLLARRETLQDRFWEGALPVLARILQEQGAVVVLDRDTVFLSSDSADITAEAIARIDAAARSGVGAAEEAPPPVEAREAPRDPAPAEPSPPAGGLPLVEPSPPDGALPPEEEPG